MVPELVAERPEHVGITRLGDLADTGSRANAGARSSKATIVGLTSVPQNRSAAED
jgi:hypothetical protein